MELQKGALLAGIPLFFGGFGCILSAWLATNFARRGFNLGKVRRTIAILGYAGAGAMLLLSPYIGDPILAMIAMGLASFSLDLALVICWDTAMHIGGSFAGTVSGAMNMAGQIGGAVGPIAVGYILQYLNRDWMLVFWISAAIYFLGGICWMWIDPVTVIANSRESQSGQPPVA
jgi:MFS family permease